MPVEEAIQAPKEKLGAHAGEIATFDLGKVDICALLDQCLHNNVFPFGDAFFRQKQDNQCAPPLAIIFLAKSEQQALIGVALKPDLLVRYIDDFAGIWNHGEEELFNFLKYIP